MSKRNFETFLNSLKRSISTWKYYTDFEKVYSNVTKLESEIKLLESLIGSNNIKDDFEKLIEEHPSVLKCIPLLMAKRNTDKISIMDHKKLHLFDFNSMTNSVHEYSNFMEKTDLFALINRSTITSLKDYIIGVEVGLDSNARKNRTGKIMEDIVEKYLQEAGFVKGQDYFKELNKSKMEKLWNLDLSKVFNQGKTEKRFDFVVKTNTQTYAIEVNFYSSGGSKLNETARSYKSISVDSKLIKNFHFIWVTDGIGWLSAKNNLLETFEVNENIYSLTDLEDGIFLHLFKN